MRAESGFVAQVLTLLSSITNAPLAEKLEKLCLFNKTPDDVYPLSVIRQFITRHLHHPKNYRALDTLILSSGADRVWLEDHVRNLQLQDGSPAYPNTYHLPDYSTHVPFHGDNEGDDDDEEEGDENGLVYPFGDYGVDFVW